MLPQQKFYSFEKQILKYIFTIWFLSIIHFHSVLLENKYQNTFLLSDFFPLLTFYCIIFDLYNWYSNMEKKLNSNYTKILPAVLNKSWRQHPTKWQLYGHKPPITKAIKVRWTRHTGHSRRSKDEFISDILLWTPSHEQAKAGWPARTYIQQLCVDTGCSLEYLPGAMDDRDGWQERARKICAGSTSWSWW